jgi:hypothetical protein
VSCLSRIDHRCRMGAAVLLRGSLGCGEVNWGSPVRRNMGLRAETDARCGYDSAAAGKPRDWIGDSNLRSAQAKTRYRNRVDATSPASAALVMTSHVQPRSPDSTRRPATFISRASPSAVVW